MGEIAREGLWYRRLCDSVGKSSVGVGPVGWHEDQSFWVSSPNDLEPTAEEHDRFYDALYDVVESAWNNADRGTLDHSDAPYVVGNFYHVRSETLVFGIEQTKPYFDTVLEVIDAIRLFLRDANHRQWRVGYFHGDASILIYPQAIFVGEDRFETAEDARTSMVRWYDYMEQL